MQCYHDSFEGVCLTHVILAPGASALGSNQAAVDHFRRLGAAWGGLAGPRQAKPRILSLGVSLARPGQAWPG